MTKVIKLDGRKEDFSKEKLGTSIKKAMESVGREDADLIKLILAEVDEFVRGKDYVLTKDLRNEVIKLLATRKDSKIARTYMMYVKEDQSPRAGRRSSKVYSPNSTI